MVKGREWSGRTNGGNIMQRLLIMMLRWVDVRVVYCFMVFFVPFYMLFNRKEYRAIRSYYSRRGKKGFARFASVCRNYLTFGQVIVDRFAVFAGRKFDFSNEGVDIFNAQLLQPQGFVILSSHMGNYELAGCRLSSKTKRIQALVFGGETAAIMESRSRTLGGNNIGVIPVAEDMSHIFKMNACFDEGDAVSMPADRVYGSQKRLVCRFMGSDAPFPAGPFVFMAQKEAVGLAVFVMKNKATKYDIIVRRIEHDSSLASAPLKARAAALAQCFATTLEDIANRYPYQWFNYFDFWKQ